MNLFQRSKHLLSSLTIQDNWREIVPCDALLICHDHDRGFYFRGQHYAQLLDSFGELLKSKGLSTTSVARPFSRFVKKKAYREPFSLNRSAFIALIKSKVQNLIQDFIKTQNQTKDASIDLWVSILKVARPNIVVAIQPEKVLCAASKKLSIPIYDLQHGNIDDESPFYSKSFGLGSNQDNLPTGYLCWNQESANVLLDWTPKKNVEVHIVGNPWFNRFLHKREDDELVQELITTESLSTSDAPTILVTLQWGRDLYSDGNVTNGVMPTELEKTILQTANQYDWLIRLHPLQLHGQEAPMVKKYMRSTFSDVKNVYWEDCSNIPLPMVMAQADLHVTYDSCTTVEASWIGLYTALLNPEIRPGGRTESYYIDERASGMAEVVPLDMNAIEMWINSAARRTKPKSRFKNQATNLESFINKIIKPPIAERAKLC